MSRIGKEPVSLPSGVTVRISPTRVVVKGPLGETSIDKLPDIAVEEKEGVLSVTRPTNSKLHRSLHGTYRQLVANMVRGVSEGFKKGLIVEGTGYKLALQGSKNLVLNVRYSHPVEYKAPEGIEFETPEPLKLVVKGIDRQKVGQVAAEIRRIQPPDPYKGKGIRYDDEVVHTKPGKAGVTAAGTGV